METAPNILPENNQNEENENLSPESMVFVPSYPFQADDGPVVVAKPAPKKGK